MLENLALPHNITSTFNVYKNIILSRQINTSCTDFIWLELLVAYISCDEDIIGEAYGNGCYPLLFTQHGTEAHDQTKTHPLETCSRGGGGGERDREREGGSSW